VAVRTSFIVTGGHLERFEAEPLAWRIVSLGRLGL
jgi:hypothetical protein